jgi:hypothetical protein
VILYLESLTKLPSRAPITESHHQSDAGPEASEVITRPHSEAQIP